MGSNLRQIVDGIAARAPFAHCSAYAKHLNTAEVFAHNAGDVVPAASVIKTCVLVEILNQAYKGKFNLDDLVTVSADTGGARGSGILKHLRLPLRLSIWNLATLMIIVSDNTASNACIDLVGFDAVNETCRAYGMVQTVLRRYFIGQAVDDPSKDNLITTEDLGVLFERMYRGELVSPKASQQMLEIMHKQQLNSRIPLHLPPGTPIAHKTGTQPTTAHDAGIVYGPGGNDYVVSIAVTRVAARPTGEAMVADISKAIWDHFAGVVIKERN